jgi:hypothetical protein
MLAGLAEVAGARHVRRAIQVLTARVAQVDLFRRDHATRVGHRMVVDDCAVGASARNRGWWSTIHENNRKLHVTGKATKTLRRRIIVILPKLGDTKSACWRRKPSSLSAAATSVMLVFLPPIARVSVLIGLVIPSLAYPASSVVSSHWKNSQSAAASRMWQFLNF